MPVKKNDTVTTIVRGVTTSYKVIKVDSGAGTITYEIELETVRADGVKFPAIERSVSVLSELGKSLTLKIA